jgi:K+-sensing histidine kinase KdpD
VRIAGVLVGVQGLAAIAFAVAVLVRGLGSAPKDAGNLYGEAGFFAIVALAVLAVAAGLLLGQRWSRTPAAIVELLLVAVAFYAVHSPFAALAVVTIVVCVATIVLLFTAPARAWAVTDPSDVS